MREHNYTSVQEKNEILKDSRDELAHFTVLETEGARAASVPLNNFMSFVEYEMF